MSWINDGDGLRALQRLECEVKRKPELFWHPYVEDMLRALDAHRSQDCNEWYFRLGKTWLEAKTRYKIKGTKPPIKAAEKGCALFPGDIRERSEAAEKMRYEIGAFMALIEDASSRVKKMGEWRATKRNYGDSPKGVIEERAVDLELIWSQFKKEHRLDGQELGHRDCERIVNDGYSSKDPVRSIACALVATLALAPFRRVKPITPTLIHNTCEYIIRRAGKGFPQTAAYTFRKMKDPYSVLR